MAFFGTVNPQKDLIDNALYSFRFILQTNILEEITTSPTSSQASVVADIVMTGNELMEMRESTTAGIQTTGMMILYVVHKRSRIKKEKENIDSSVRTFDQ